jgi:hypothetical protein
MEGDDRDPTAVGAPFGVSAAPVIDTVYSVVAREDTADGVALPPPQAARLRVTA